MLQSDLGFPLMELVFCSGKAQSGGVALYFKSNVKDCVHFYVLKLFLILSTQMDKQKSILQK